jgi:hypothetical protein
MPPLAPPRTSRDLRRAALAAVIAAVMFGVLARLFGVGDSFAVVFDRYHSLFMPARFAFAIWLAIHAAFIAYAVVIRRGSRLAVAGHDQQARLLVAASILGPAWMIAFKLDLISFSMLLMIAMLVVAIAMFLDAQDLCRRERLSAVWTVPFSLYLGWIGASTLINLGVWLVAIGWRGGGLGETQLAVGMIVVSAMLGIGVGFRFADAVVPMVVAWALFGIWSGQRHADLAVAVSAFGAGSACAIGAALALIRKVVQARNEHAPRHIALIGT